MNIWRISLGIAAMALHSQAATTQPDPTSTQIYYRIGPNIEPANAEMEIPHNAEEILIDIGDQTEELFRQGHRVRYKLEGVDPDWRQKRDEMSVTVLFYNSSGDQVGQQIYLVNGKSPGWSGAVESSTFTPRHEDLTVPPGAERLGITISSAGPPTTVGIFVVNDLLVTQEGEGQEKPETILDSSAFLRGGSSAPIPGWIRTGRRPSMARLIPSPGAATPAQAFCILDDDPTSYAEWTSVWQNTPTVTPGRRLSISWNEIYDTGLVKWNRVDYMPPPPGRYRFAVQELDILDHPLPVTKEIEITVLPPYWKDPWFWTKCVGGAALVIFLAIRIRRYSQHRLQQQRIRLVEQERMRIARDLHDDLGARITHISLMSSFAGTNKSLADPSAKFSEISVMARDLVDSLSEVVWAVNPEEDRLDSMVDYLCQAIRRLCQGSSITCRIDEFTERREYVVSSQIRHHIVLAVKEAVNNAIKHSGATELHASIQFRAPILTISITDNGKGVPTDLSSKGNGIRNMRERAALMNGRMEIKTEASGGTRIIFEVPIT